MSRKAKAWVTATTSTVPSEGDVATPKLTALQLGYSAYKPDTKTNRIRQPLVVLYHAAHVLQTTETEIASPHPAVLVATMLTKLNSSSTTNSSNHKTIILVDLSALIPLDNFEEWMDEEGTYNANISTSLFYSNMIVHHSIPIKVLQRHWRRKYRNPPVVCWRNCSCKMRHW